MVADTQLLAVKHRLTVECLIVIKTKPVSEFSFFGGTLGTTFFFRKALQEFIQNKQFIIEACRLVLCRLT